MHIQPLTVAAIVLSIIIILLTTRIAYRLTTVIRVPTLSSTPNTASLHHSKLSNVSRVTSTRGSAASTDLIYFERRKYRTRMQTQLMWVMWCYVAGEIGYMSYCTFLAVCARDGQCAVENVSEVPSVVLFIAADGVWFTSGKIRVLLVPTPLSYVLCFFLFTSDLS